MINKTKYNFILLTLFTLMILSCTNLKGEESGQVDLKNKEANSNSYRKFKMELKNLFEPL